MATVTAAERLAAYRAAFEAVLAAFTELEQALGKSPREVRAEGRLGEAVATASTAVRGLPTTVASSFPSKAGTPLSTERPISQETSSPRRRCRSILMRRRPL